MKQRYSYFLNLQAFLNIFFILTLPHHSPRFSESRVWCKSVRHQARCWGRWQVSTLPTGILQISRLGLGLSCFSGLIIHTTFIYRISLKRYGSVSVYDVIVYPLGCVFWVHWGVLSCVMQRLNPECF